MMSVVDEQFYIKEHMTEEEFYYYLKLFENCKDICDSNYKVNGNGKCEILRFHLNKVEPGIITLNSIVYIGKENRIVNGYIFERGTKTVIDIYVERLLVNKDKTYRTVDIFKEKDDKLIRTSCYNHEKETVEEIDKIEMKEKLK